MLEPEFSSQMRVCQQLSRCHTFRQIVQLGNKTSNRDLYRHSREIDNHVSSIRGDTARRQGNQCKGIHVERMLHHQLQADIVSIPVRRVSFPG